MEFVLSDESLNAFGFRVLTEGIDVKTRYEKNPVILYQHNDIQMSVGKMSVRKENGKLIGTPEFDVDDDVGKDLDRKYRNGYMNGFSVGIEPVELSDDESNLVQGQTRMTITKSLLLEVSVANIPANANSVKLSNSELNDVPKLNYANMKQIAIKLGLDENVSEQKIVETITAKDTEIERLRKENKELSDTKAQLEQENQQQKQQHLEQLINDPKKALTDEQKNAYRELAKTNYDHAVKLIKLQKDVTPLHKVPGSGADEYEGKSFKALQKEAPQYLERLKSENPEKFKELYKAEFGNEPKL